MSATTSLGRADRLATAAAGRGLDALLVTERLNVRWVTGFTGSNGIALLGAGEDGVRRFVTDFRYLTQSAEELDERWERVIGPDLLAELARHLPEAPRLHLGYDDANLTVRDCNRLADLAGDAVELVPAGGVVEGLRAVKDARELRAIRAAAQLADSALLEVLERGLAGRTERDVAIDLEFTMRRLGAEAVSFPPIVASGPHAALPHATSRNVEIEPGALVVVDWGAQVDGYTSDCTRTYGAGEPDPRDREIYDLVRVAQEQALAAVAPGRTGREVDAVARDVIEHAGHGEHFGHGLGHGVGLAVHEGPRLSQQSDTTLAPGMVVTVEPGVYVPGATGVRIEDLVAVTDVGCEVLNGLSKDFTVV